VTYQPYYVAFAAAHGRTPEQQDEALTRPDGSWRGGPFIAWICARHRQFKALHGLPPRVPYSDEQRALFLDWLAAGAWL